MKVKVIIGVGTDAVPDSLFKWAVTGVDNSILLDILTAVVKQNFELFFYDAAKDRSMKLIPKQNQVGGTPEALPKGTYLVSCPLLFWPIESVRLSHGTISLI